jgi:PAS domain S-box-containing protein
MSEATGDAIRVLHVDDNEDLAALVATHLDRTHEDIEVETETSAEAGLQRLRDGCDGVDCVVSDHDMPGMDGLDFLRAVREVDESLPFILFTGKGNEEIASEAISAGVTEYLQKGTGTEQYAVLANRIERAVGEERAKEALQESERMLSTLISNLPGMVYRCRNERGWPMEFVSEGCEELTGYPAEVVESGEVVWGEDVILDEVREDLWERVQTALDAREPFEVTYRIATAEGDTRWLWERGSGVYEDDELVALEGFITDITARKHRDRELREQQEFVESLLDTLGDPFYLLDTQGNFVRWNDRLRQVTGYSDDELTSMAAADVIADDHVPRLAESMDEVIEQGRTTMELDVVTKAGERIPFEMRGAPVHDTEETLIGTVGIARDMSERLERERELEQYRTLVENVGDPMYVLEADGTVAMVNHAMEEHLGYPREAIVGEPPTMVMVEEDVAKGDEVIQSLYADDETEWKTWEMRTVDADGNVILTENQTAVLTDGDGEFVGSVGVIRDITDRVERERELERTETIIQAVEDPVYALDAEGHFTFVNDAFEPMTGYSVEDLLGEHISTVVREVDVERGQDHIQEMLRGDVQTVTYEIEVLPETGSPVPSELHIAPLPFEDEFRGTAGIIRDIEERKEREDRLEEFASVVSHDLRGPLNVVLGRIELARETGDLDQLAVVEDAAERMERLVQDLLALARNGQTVGEAVPVALDEVAASAWESVETGDATLVADSASEIEADPDRLRELLENLFRNALQHGTATTALEPRRDGVDESSSNPGSSSPRGPASKHAGAELTVRVDTVDEGFYVADDGRGIDRTDRDKVFDQGYTTRQDGTGFGLAIVSRIAGAHDWGIEVTESEAGGARFVFRT